MFGKAFQRKYALSDQGIRNAKAGTFWTVIVNLVVMGGMGVLYLMMRGYIATLTDGAPLSGGATILLLVLVFLILSFITHLQQYKATYGLVYGEVKNMRISLAERLRKLPLGYFGKRDLADLTETIMGDVNRLEHVWSHCLGYLYGAFISTAIIREIRVTNQEDRFLKALYDKIDYHEKTMLQGELSAGIFVNAASVIMRLGVATTILTGTKLILSGQIDFLVLFMDIVFENVGFAYDNKRVLRGVYFTAKEGEVTALVGPSGSGKSTCARLAARLWDVDEGAIRVGGVDIQTIDPEVLLSDYSMVFQDVVLFDDTVMENIRLGKHGASDEEVLAAAKAANCDEFVEKLPLGYDTPIGENGAKLSGGERQRISIARALLKNAPIVLLDEATASLDVENETKVQGALSRLLTGKTVLVIAHRMRTVEAADKIVVLANGKVAEEGRPEEILAKEDSMFSHMAKLQTANAFWSIGSEQL